MAGTVWVDVTSALKSKFKSWKASKYPEEWRVEFDLFFYLSWVWRYLDPIRNEARDSRAAGLLSRQKRGSLWLPAGIRRNGTWKLKLFITIQAFLKGR